MQVQRIVREITKVSIAPNVQENTKLRVCAYARVSTLNEEQEESFERQVAHYTQYINSRGDWQLVDIYADQGLTGTKAEKRPQFMQMIKDCVNGKIDRILVKSISRFARNTIDSLTYIRKLKELGIAIHFENENIDTMTPGGEMLITILSGIAEQESRNMSTNIKWAYQKKFKRGEVVIGNLMGYHKNEKGEYEIVQQEAEIIRRIFREYLCGYSGNQICDGLMADGIQSPKKGQWRKASIMNILQNEKYAGNAILGKTFKPDVLSNKRLKNEGQSPKYFVEGSHPAIVSKEVFDLVQLEIAKRNDLRSFSTTGEGRYTSKYPFSGMIICKDCGSKYRRLVRKREGKEELGTWCCANRIVNHDGTCQSITLKEITIEETYLKALKRLVDVSVTQKLIDNIEETIAIKVDEQMAAVEDKIVELQSRAIGLHRAKKAGDITQEEYTASLAYISGELSSLEREQKTLQEKSASAIMNERRISIIKELAGDNKLLNKFDADIMKTLLQQIVVKDKETLELKFKCGITLEEKI